jgi:glutamate 5-kinase
MNRTAVTAAKRIVLKVGSSSLTGSAGSALDASAVG